MSGIVYLVGAGPGDAELITLKGARLLRECDAVVYDRLANPELLSIAASAEQYDVGKQDGMRCPTTQDTINALLVRLARSGKRVVRLKGGDPFVFGRGGEEADALVAAGIPFEVVPGVTAGVAVPAYAGIPVTYRGIASMVTFVTANADPARINAPIDWRALGWQLAQQAGTLVIFMGARTFASIAPLLMDGGLSAHTPAAAIEWGTYAHQRTVVATLKTLSARITSAGLAAPITIVLGDVVRLRDRIAWFAPPRQVEQQCVEYAIAV